MAELNRALEEAVRIRAEQNECIRQHILEPIRILPHPPQDQILTVLVCRNEALRLPACLQHYRDLGIRRFAIIDNGSADATRSIILSEDDVDVYAIDSGYPEARSGCYWRSRLYDYYGLDRWYLSVDADELLIYDGMTKHGLIELTSFLQKKGAKSLLAFLIDMYSEKPFAEVAYSPGDSMIDACPYFDGDYNIRDWGSLPWITGGPRDRITPGKPDSGSHNLRKFPLFYWDQTAYRKNNHEFAAFNNKPFFGGALLHFKMLPDFESKVDQALIAKNHWNGAEFYQRYKNGIKDGRLTSPFYENSRRFADPVSLVQEGLMLPIEWSSHSIPLEPKDKIPTKT